METVVIQINNSRSFGFFENLEALNIIKILKRIPYSQCERGEKAINVHSGRANRLSE